MIKALCRWARVHGAATPGLTAADQRFREDVLMLLGQPRLGDGSPPTHYACWRAPSGVVLHLTVDVDRITLTAIGNDEQLHHRRTARAAVVPEVYDLLTPYRAPIEPAPDLDAALAELRGNK